MKKRVEFTTLFAFSYYKIQIREIEIIQLKKALGWIIKNSKVEEAQLEIVLQAQKEEQEIMEIKYIKVAADVAEDVVYMLIKDFFYRDLTTIIIVVGSFLDQKIYTYKLLDKKCDVEN
ncbi:MAG: hypothetical protein RSE41_09515 [Clostridia bacterium]